MKFIQEEGAEKATAHAESPQRALLFAQPPPRGPPRTGPQDQSIPGSLLEHSHTAGLLPSSSLIRLWGPPFLGLCRHWLLFRFFTGRHQQVLVTPPLILHSSQTLSLREPSAELPPPPEGPSAPVLLPPCLLLLLPLLDLHQLFKTFGCCGVHHKPVLSVD